MSRPWWQKLLCWAGEHGPQVRETVPPKLEHFVPMTTEHGGSYLMQVPGEPAHVVVKCLWCDTTLERLYR